MGNESGYFSFRNFDIMAWCIIVLKYLEKAPECNIATSTIDKLRMVLNVIRGDKDVNTFMGFDVDKQMSVPLAELTFEGVLAGVDCDKAVFILAPL